MYKNYQFQRVYGCRYEKILLLFLLSNKKRVRGERSKLGVQLVVREMSLILCVSTTLLRSSSFSVLRSHHRYGSYSVCRKQHITGMNIDFCRSPLFCMGFQNCASYKAMGSCRLQAQITGRPCSTCVHRGSWFLRPRGLRVWLIVLCARPTGTTMYNHHFNEMPQTALILCEQGKEPEYLDYNIKGRGFWERMPYNAGALYITGEKS